MPLPSSPRHHAIKSTLSTLQSEEFTVSNSSRDQDSSIRLTAAMKTLSAFLFPAPPSLFVNVMTVVSSAVVAVIGLSEARGTAHLQYSKFWNTSNNIAPKSSSSEKFKVSSRLGMLLLYTPAVLAGAVSLWFFPIDDRRILLLKYALTIHFFKRDFEVLSGLSNTLGVCKLVGTSHPYSKPNENSLADFNLLYILRVLFVHKYSGKMVLDSAIIISLSYFSSTALMIYTQHLSKALPEPSIDLKNIGIALFSIGIIGNLYHHYILSQTRKKGETGYKIPKGGLFSIVICPHYLLEITVYLGFALISQTIYSLCFAIATAIYLGGRSYATRQWYVSKFEDFPKHVKALIPFVF